MGGGKTYAKGKARTIDGVYYPSFEEKAKALLEEYGCLHFKFSVLLGVSTPAHTKEQLAQLKANDKKTFEFEGKKYTKYEASQTMSQIESRVKKLKDRANIATAAGDDDLRREEQYKINLLTNKYAKLSETCELPTKMERMQVAGYRPVKMKTLTNAAGQTIIEVDSTTLKGIPNSITQKTSRKGGIERNYYDGYGNQYKQISNNDHGKPKQHPFGKNGEHAHDYIYDDEGNLIGRPIRPLTDLEEKESADIL